MDIKEFKNRYFSTINKFYNCLKIDIFLRLINFIIGILITFSNINSCWFDFYYGRMKSSLIKLQIQPTLFGKMIYTSRWMQEMCLKLYCLKGYYFLINFHTRSYDGDRLQRSKTKQIINHYF